MSKINLVITYFLLSSIAIIGSSNISDLSTINSTFTWAPSGQPGNIVLELSSLQRLIYDPHAHLSNNALLNRAVICAYHMRLGRMDNRYFYPPLILTYARQTISIPPQSVQGFPIITPARSQQSQPQASETITPTRTQDLKSYYEPIITPTTARGIPTGEEFALFFTRQNTINNLRTKERPRTRARQTLNYDFDANAFASWLIEHRTNVTLERERQEIFTRSASIVRHHGPQQHSHSSQTGHTRSSSNRTKPFITHANRHLYK